jgi:hypothetical protein
MGLKLDGLLRRGLTIDGRCHLLSSLRHD